MLTDVSKNRTVFIFRVKISSWTGLGPDKGTKSFETSIKIYQLTRRNIPASSLYLDSIFSHNVPLPRCIFGYHLTAPSYTIKIQPPILLNFLPILKLVAKFHFHLTEYFQICSTMHFSYFILAGVTFFYKNQAQRPLVVYSKHLPPPLSAAGIPQLAPQH